MDRMLLGQIPVPSNSKGKGKAVEDDGYDTDVLDGAHVLATMMGISHVADKKDTPDVDENVSRRSHDHNPIISFLKATESRLSFFLNDQAIKTSCSILFSCELCLLQGSFNDDLTISLRRCVAL